MVLTEIGEPLRKERWLTNAGFEAALVDLVLGFMQHRRKTAPPTH